MLFKQSSQAEKVCGCNDRQVEVILGQQVEYVNPKAMKNWLSVGYIFVALLDANSDRNRNIYSIYVYCTQESMVRRIN